MAAPKPVQGGRGNFQNLARTQAEEDAFDYVQFRNVPKPTGVIGSIAHMVKGALGGGILGGHVAYMKAGVGIAGPFNILFGIYMGYCLYILVMSAQKLYRRTHVPSMSYPDVGEAAMACFPNPKIARFSRFFRYSIDAIICIDLFGACACYQIIIAKSIKQLVEDTQRTTVEGIAPGYPSLRVYLACMILPVILICMIHHLKWLAPFSIGANVVVLVIIFVAVYYAFVYNPTLIGMVNITKLYSYFEFVGMTVFSMSCAGVVIPIENNMKDPNKYPLVLVVGPLHINAIFTYGVDIYCFYIMTILTNGVLLFFSMFDLGFQIFNYWRFNPVYSILFKRMTLIILCTFLVSFFGYAAFLENCESPITVNFPMSIGPKILKFLIIIMIYVTHALNFWVPFNLCFYYLKQRHPEEKHLRWELFYRACFVVMIAIIAIIFPNINALMGFLGTFCLSNMAFIWPNVIYLLTCYERPGLGKYNWRLWKAMVLIVIGFFLLICGSTVNINELISVFR